MDPIQKPKVGRTAEVLQWRTNPPFTFTVEVEDLYWEEDREAWEIAYTAVQNPDQEDLVSPRELVWYALWDPIHKRWEDGEF